MKKRMVVFHRSIKPKDGKGGFSVGVNTQKKEKEKKGTG